ncbi:glycosyltransferase [Rhodococcus sp. Eu-32]|uniref:glycosyltransferase family 4 protein n=1 Tax=Rhodococcus sp. Eu-32 TaxID=1017319 RepID=UPI000DF1BBC7|nr:glycosyltransferase family 4 protein [Rhodococcus sp. Eu-32]RRQ29115.1 glycosyltransferase [Rhodococcus sp. Eu-32]
MRAHVPLAGMLSATQWRRRYDAGEVPDATPYGLHKLAENGIETTFGTAKLGRARSRVGASVRYRVDGLELVEALGERRNYTRSKTDAVLCYDERTGIPAALLAESSRRYAPVVSGIGWITHRSAPYPKWNGLFAHALAKTPALWSQSRPVLDTLHHEWGVEKERLHFVPLGIDADFYGVQTDPPVPGRIMSAGEDRFRDHALLVDAVAAVRRSVPEAFLELATGLPVDVPEDLGTVHTERLDGRMRNLYQRASVVALALRPTISGSGLTVVLEAMASGRPVVVTDNPGMSDYVEDGVTGVLVPGGDVDALADAIARLLADPDRAAAMGHAAAARVRSQFTSSVMAYHLAQIVRSV